MARPPKHRQEPPRPSDRLAAIKQGHKVLYRETKKETIERKATAPLIIDDLGMRKPPSTAAEDLLEVSIGWSASPPHFASYA